jgi:hypothetical protein
VKDGSEYNLISDVAGTTLTCPGIMKEVTAKTVPVIIKDRTAIASGMATNFLFNKVFKSNPLTQPSQYQR